MLSRVGCESFWKWRKGISFLRWEEPAKSYMRKSNSGLENDEMKTDRCNQGMTASEKGFAVAEVQYVTARMRLLFDREESCYIRYFTHPRPSLLMKVVYTILPSLESADIRSLHQRVLTSKVQIILCSAQKPFVNFWMVTLSRVQVRSGEFRPHVPAWRVDSTRSEKGCMGWCTLLEELDSIRRWVPQKY